MTRVRGDAPAAGQRGGRVPAARRSETSATRQPGRLRNTRQAAAVEAVLRDADGFRTAQDLFAELRRRGDRIGLTTVYRHLNMLAEQGRADIVHSSEGESQYRLCGVGTPPEGDPGDHHHHLVCRACGRSVEVSGPEVEAWADRVSAAAGYTAISHTLEVFGLCPEHSAGRTSRGR
jgi:Fur family transcriptional regulator, ferric uptake regulator